MICRNLAPTSCAVHVVNTMSWGKVIRYPSRALQIVLEVRNLTLREIAVVDVEISLVVEPEGA